MTLMNSVIISVLRVDVRSLGAVMPVNKTLRPKRKREFPDSKQSLSLVPAKSSNKAGET